MIPATTPPIITIRPPRPRPVLRPGTPYTPKLDDFTFNRRRLLYGVLGDSDFYQGTALSAIISMLGMGVSKASRKETLWVGALGAVAGALVMGYKLWNRPHWKRY